jgi:hypothetical protein
VAADAHSCGRGGAADAHPHGRTEVGEHKGVVREEYTQHGQAQAVHAHGSLRPLHTLARCCRARILLLPIRLRGQVQSWSGGICPSACMWLPCALHGHSPRCGQRPHRGPLLPIRLGRRVESFVLLHQLARGTPSCDGPAQGHAWWRLRPWWPVMAGL